ncbi:MAG: hypothetical protein SCH71_09810 [Desulfobulbaceae bacterium]|nr:hypothetical protein [Desulfobulbaceae bacterium]
MCELARGIFAVDQASKKSLRKSEALTLDEFIKKSRAESMVRQTNNLLVESQQLKEEVARLRKKVFDMHMSAKEQKQSEEKVRREAESQLKRNWLRRRGKSGD